MDVECKFRCLNSRIVSDRRRDHPPAFGVTGIADDWPRSAMGVVVIGLITLWSAGENFGCNWQHLGGPVTSLGAPASSLGELTTSLGAPTTTLGAPTPGLGAPTTSLEAPTMSLRTPMTSLGAPKTSLIAPGSACN